MYSYGPPHMAVQKQDDQHEHTFSNYVRIQDVVQKTCLRRWTIGKSGERGSGISVLPARHDDDDDDDDILWPQFIKSLCRLAQLILNNWPFYKNQKDIFSLFVSFFKTNVFDIDSAMFCSTEEITDPHTRACVHTHTHAGMNIT